MRDKLVARGYGKNAVENQLLDELKMDRGEALRRVEKKKDEYINFVTTHSAYLLNVGKILGCHGHYLQEDGLENYIEEILHLSLRKGKNIGDMKVNAKERKEGLGTGPCLRGCALCKDMRRTDKVKDKDGKELKIRGTMNCQTVEVIYGMFCEKCRKVVYVGKTINKLRDRFYGHKQDMKGNDEDKPVMFSLSTHYYQNLQCTF
jgi:hypothetical protein